MDDNLKQGSFRIIDGIDTIDKFIVKYGKKLDDNIFENIRTNLESIINNMDEITYGKEGVNRNTCKRNKKINNIIKIK